MRRLINKLKLRALKRKAQKLQRAIFSNKQLISEAELTKKKHRFENKLIEDALSKVNDQIVLLEGEPRNEVKLLTSSISTNGHSDKLELTKTGS